MPYEILLQHASIVSCLCVFGISHFGLYYLYSSTNDSITEEVLVTDEVDPGTEKARKELEERLEKRKAEKKETEERLEKQRAEKQDQEERQYNLKIDGKDVADLTGKMVELVGTSIPIGVTESGVSTFDVLA